MFFINPKACDFDYKKIKSEIYKCVSYYDNERYNQLDSEKEEYVRKVNDKECETIIEGLWGRSGENIQSHAHSTHVGETIEELKNRHKKEASSFKEYYHMMVVVTDFFYTNMEKIAKWYADPDNREPFKADITPIHKSEKNRIIGYGIKYNNKIKDYEIMLTPSATAILQKSKDMGLFLDTIYPNFNNPQAFVFAQNNTKNIENQIADELNLDYLEDQEYINDLE